MLAGCAHSDAAALATQACVQVHHGLAAEREAAAQSGTRAAQLRTLALEDIRAALPLAAVAAGEDTTWQALDATLSESNRVPLRYLVTALTAQCAPNAGVG